MSMPGGSPPGCCLPSFSFVDAAGAFAVRELAPLLLTALVGTAGLSLFNAGASLCPAVSLWPVSTRRKSEGSDKPKRVATCCFAAAKP